MTILSKLLARGSHFMRQANVQRRVMSSVSLKYRQSSTSASSTVPNNQILYRAVSSQPSNIAEEFYPLGNFIVNHSTMPVVDIMDSDTLDKLMEYSTISPYPVSIEELIEHGDRNNYSEERSYWFLKKEVAVRLAHMIMEIQHLPRELQAEEKCLFTIQKYSQSFKEVIEFENKDPTTEVLHEFMELLFKFKDRHSVSNIDAIKSKVENVLLQDTVHNMAQACLSMKERLNIPADDVNSLIFASIKVFLDRLYTSRIGIHMITNQVK